MSVIVGYARTPFMRYNGRLAEVPATQLGAHAVAAALSRAGLAPSDVNTVIAGQVLQAGAGQNPARQTTVAAGIPLITPAATLNVVCLSGSEAVAAAHRMIEAGEIQVAVAVGQESMSLAPHAWSGSRRGQRYGAIEFIDTMDHDGLTDAFEERSMGASTEDGNRDLGLDRASQDAWAARSHQLAAAAEDFLAGEIEPFTVRGRTGDEVFGRDDGIRPDTTPETLSQLRAAFAADGTITAGNSSQITDGAAAVVLMSAPAAAERGITAWAEVVSHAFVAGPDVRLHAQPATAIRAALNNTGIDTSQLAAIEMNEAFASVTVHSTRLLGVDPALVNIHGGAIALGHPIGASGARLVGTLARTLQSKGAGSLGAAALCGGGGQGSALIIRAL